MIPGKSHPRPYQRLWVGAYTDKKSEYFELRTADKTGKFSYSALWHKYAPLGSAIADFLYDDLKHLDNDLRTVKAHIDAYNAGKEREQALRGFFDLSKLWLSDNPLYVPLAAALERLEIDTANGNILNTDEIEHMMDEYRAWQPKLKTIAHCVLESEDNGDMRRAYLEKQGADADNFPQLLYGKLHLEAVYSGGNIPYPYDDLLNFGQFSEPTAITAEVLNTESVSDLICFLLCRYLEANLRFHACKFCGKLFGVTGNYKQEYCSRVIPGSEKTCKEMGSVRLYEKKIFSEPAIKEYKRSYKAHNARIRYGLMTREEFDKWAAEAREKRDACVAGKLSLEDFVAWLDSDKQR